MERSTDNGVTWTRHGPITVAGEPFGVIQPTLWETASGEVRMLMRSTERIGRLVASSSRDHGLTWQPGRATLLPNPNAGIDVVRMKAGRLVLVYNHLLHGRDSLHIAISTDEGNTWSIRFFWKGARGNTPTRRSYKDIEIPKKLHVYEDAYIKEWIEQKGFRVVPCYIPFCIHYRPPDVWTFKGSVGLMAEALTLGDTWLIGKLLAAYAFYSGYAMYEVARREGQR